jgi:hypothetical protein
MPIDDYGPADMQILMHAIEHVCIFLKLTESEEHLALKSRVTALIVECSEGGERDPQKLIDCAHARLAKDRLH